MLHHMPYMAGLNQSHDKELYHMPYEKWLSPILCGKGFKLCTELTSASSDKSVAIDDVA